MNLLNTIRHLIKIVLYRENIYAKLFQALRIWIKQDLQRVHGSVTQRVFRSQLYPLMLRRILIGWTFQLHY